MVLAICWREVEQGAGMMKGRDCTMDKLGTYYYQPQVAAIYLLLKESVMVSRGQQLPTKTVSG